MKVQVLENFKGPKRTYKKGETIEGKELEKLLETNTIECLCQDKLVKIVDGDKSKEGEHKFRKDEGDNFGSDKNQSNQSIGKIPANPQSAHNGPSFGNQVHTDHDDNDKNHKNDHLNNSDKDDKGATSFDRNPPDKKVKK